MYKHFPVCVGSYFLLFHWPKKATWSTHMQTGWFRRQTLLPGGRKEFATSFAVYKIKLTQCHLSKGLSFHYHPSEFFPLKQICMCIWLSCYLYFKKKLQVAICPIIIHYIDYFTLNSLLIHLMVVSSILLVFLIISF